MAARTTVYWRDPDMKARAERYLETTYDGSMSEFLRRIAMEKVVAWELQTQVRSEQQHQERTPA